MRYRLNVVGGPYDGVPGFYWDTDVLELPESILVGTCRGDGLCGLDECGAFARRRSSHPAFWVDREEGSVGVSTIRYTLEDTSDPDDGEELGVATYAIGGLDVSDWLAESEGVPALAGGSRRPVAA